MMTLEEIRRKEREFRILAPLSRGWKRKGILNSEANRLMSARYDVTVCIPMSSRPRLETRRMYGWQLHDFSRVLAECGTFLVEVKPVRRVGGRKS